MSGPAIDPALYRERDVVPVKRAIVAVSDKTGLVELAQALVGAGVEIVSTGGTSAAIAAAGIPVTQIGDLTGFPEHLDGRVRTLHPKVHSGLLADLRLESHEAELAQFEIEPFELVVVNLYPFAATVASGAEPDAVVEQIDIGGPAMVRAAAKNHANVAVVTDPARYADLVDAILAGGTTLLQRRELAREAFRHTASYDIGVASWIGNVLAPDDEGSGFPGWMGASLAARRRAALRRELAPARGPVREPERRRHRPGPAAAGQGDVVQQLRRRGCGGACRVRPRDADGRDHQARQPVRHRDGSHDRRGARPRARVRPGVGVRRRDRLEPPDHPGSRRVDRADLHRGDHRARLRARRPRGSRRQDQPAAARSCPRGSATAAPSSAASRAGFSCRRSTDSSPPHCSGNSPPVRPPTRRRSPTSSSPGGPAGPSSRTPFCSRRAERRSASGWGRSTASTPASSPSTRAGDRARGSVAASDAFFPFEDGPQILLDAGVRAIVQPGGSVRDGETIAAVEAAGVTMYFTGERHFFH